MILGYTDKEMFPWKTRTTWLSSGNGVQKFSRNNQREKPKQKQLIESTAVLVPNKGYLSTPITKNKL
jgi:hypothetical protein